MTSQRASLLLFVTMMLLDSACSGGDADPDAGGDADRDDGGESDSGADGSTLRDAYVPDASDDAGPRDGSPGDAMPDAAVPPSGGRCMPNGFCWEHPSRFGIPLRAVWGANASDVWAVGFGGAILHFDGSEWTVQASPVRETLNAIAGTSPSDIWIVGEAGTVLHREGDRWTLVDIGATQDLNAVQIAPSGEVWIAGRLELHRYDGSVWSSPTSLSPPDSDAHLLVRTDSDVWLSSSGFVQHWDGSTWTWVPVHTDGFSASITSIVSAGTDIYLYARERDPVFRWDASYEGFRPVRLPSPVDLVVLNGGIVTASASNDVWVTGDAGVVHFDGTTWSTVLDRRIRPARGAWITPTGGFIVGDDGMILERRANSILMNDPSASAGAPSLHYSAHFGRTSSDEWVLTRGELLRRGLTETAWNPITIDGYETSHFGILGSEIWFGTPFYGDESIVVFSGGETLRAAATDPVAHQWTSFVWARPDGMELLFAGRDGIVSRSASGSFMSYGGGWTIAIDGSDDDVWAVGAGGTVRRRNGGDAFASLTSGVGSDLFAVHYVSPTEVWIGGARSTLLRWDGTFNPVALPTLRMEPGIAERGVRSIAGALDGPHGLWVAVTGGEVIEMRVGREPVVHSLHFGLADIEFATPDELVIVGRGQSIVRRTF